MRLLLWGFGFSRIVKSIPLTRCPRPRALRCSRAGGDDLGNVRQEWLPHNEKWKNFIYVINVMRVFPPFPVGTPVGLLWGGWTLLPQWGTPTEPCQSWDCCRDILVSTEHIISCPEV